MAALKEAGIEHEYMLFPDEGHGFAKPENRIKFYTAAERFLARYLGGRFEDVSPPALSRGASAGRRRHIRSTRFTSHRGWLLAWG